MKKILWIVMLMVSMTTYAQKTPEIYRIFDAQGKEVSYEKMIKTVSATDVVLRQAPSFTTDSNERASQICQCRERKRTCFP